MAGDGSDVCIAWFGVPCRYMSVGTYYNDHSNCWGNDKQCPGKTPQIGSHTLRFWMHDHHHLCFRALP